MEALNFIKKYHKEYKGEIDNSIYDEDGHNYYYYSILYNKDTINLLDYFDKDISKLDLLDFMKKYNNRNSNYIYNNKKILITKDFNKLTKIYNNIRIRDIYIDNIETLDYINADIINIILLNEGMKIKKIRCHSLNCKNCIFDYLFLKKSKSLISNRINNLTLNYVDDVIIENNEITNLYLKNCSNIKNINCNCENIFINNNKYRSFPIKHIIFKKLIFTCYDIDNNFYKFIIKLENNKIIKKISDNDINNIDKEKYKIIEFYSRKHKNQIIYYVNDKEVLIKI